MLFRSVHLQRDHQVNLHLARGLEHAIRDGVVSADAAVPNNNYQSLNVGAEFSFMDFFLLRGGYNSLFLKDAEGGLSFGAGVNSKMLLSTAIVNFDYAFRDFGKLKNVHSFSVGIKF